MTVVVECWCGVVVGVWCGGWKGVWWLEGGVVVGG